MPIVEVPIDKLTPGMYLVGIDVSWKGSSFVEREFLIALQLDVDALKTDGVSMADVDTKRSVVSFDGTDFKNKPKNLPRKIETRAETSVKQKVSKKEAAEAVKFDREIESAKGFRKETVDTLKQIFLSSTNGEPIQKEQIDSIVNDSHDAVLKNTHALLSLFHSDGQQTDLENHSFNVMSLSIMLGEQMELSETEISQLGSAALLMDIGWSELPHDLFKNISEYTEDEFEIVKTHVDLGVDILEDGNIDPEVISLVAKHHERLDGSGYFSYHGKDVPLLCCLLSVADHYNSAIRGYYGSPAIIPSTALKAIYAKSKQGSHEVVVTEKLIQLVGIFPVSSAIQLTTGEKGLVTKVNWRDAMNPIVTLYYDQYGKKLSRPFKMDLSCQDKTSKNVRKIKTLLDITNRGIDPAGVLNFSV